MKTENENQNQNEREAFRLDMQENPQTQLLECPFCQGPAEYWQSAVRCGKCMIGTLNAQSWQSAQKKWNRRKA